MTTTFGRFTFLVLCCFVTFAPAAHAQFSGSAIQQNAELELNPQYPEPFEQVTASLNAYAYDTQGASIRWYIDGTEETEAQNSRELKFTTGALGSAQTVRSTVIFPDGQSISASRTIKPSRLDLIIEADTLVPPMYRGRALPSSGSTVRAIAVPATAASVNTLSFTWRLNGKVLFGGPIRGKDVAVFTAPADGNPYLSVEIADQNGSVFMKKTTELPIAAPEMRFYEDNPLRGTSRNALLSPHFLVGDEIVVRAEPYYMASDIFSKNPYTTWSIDGRKVENPSDDAQLITLRKGEGSGRFRVNFDIRNAANLLQGGEGEFLITF